MENMDERDMFDEDLYAEIIELINQLYPENFYSDPPDYFPASFTYNSYKMYKRLQFELDNIDSIQFGIVGGNYEDTQEFYQISMDKDISTPHQNKNRLKTIAMMDRLKVSSLFFYFFRMSTIGPYVAEPYWQEYVKINQGDYSLKSHFSTETKRQDEVVDIIDDVFEKLGIHVLSRELLRKPIPNMSGHFGQDANLIPTIFVCLYGNINEERYNVYKNNL